MEEAPLRLEYSLDTLGGLGLLPQPTPGIQLGLALRRPTFGLSAEIRWYGTIATVAQLETESVDGYLTMGVFSGCWYPSFFVCCTSFQISDLVAHAKDRVVPEWRDLHIQTFHPLTWALAGRGGVRYHVSPGLYIGTFLELAAVGFSTGFTLNDKRLWVPPPFNGTLGIQLTLTIWKKDEPRK